MFVHNLHLIKSIAQQNHELIAKKVSNYGVYAKTEQHSAMPSGD